ncbi:hypothetical protein [Haliovirga abyssi]|uniref:Type 4 fimbrial biogenesis protein PilX N-terminal domain-containing protein n=1 Tax=Haliovirga abyssi TaxID=2996794 RepID=A0AAU9D9W8_9FUSO|nr:hypothetical protein [Haliovirga abyssi]BDU51438.1 hypothetical protein HLVA_20070 [Haliovirga abyssi]
MKNSGSSVIIVIFFMIVLIIIGIGISSIADKGLESGISTEQINIDDANADGISNVVMEEQISTGDDNWSQDLTDNPGHKMSKVKTYIFVNNKIKEFTFKMKEIPGETITNISKIYITVIERNINANWELDYIKKEESSLTVIDDTKAGETLTKSYISQENGELNKEYKIKLKSGFNGELTNRDKVYKVIIRIFYE